MTNQRLALWFAPRFYWALAAVATLLACSPGVPLFVPAAFVASAALAIAVVVDLIRGPSPALVAARRRIPDHLSLRSPAKISYDVTNASNVAVRTFVIDGPVRTLELAAAVPAFVPPRSSTAIEREAIPVARGRDAFSALYAWYENGIGLLRRRVRCDQPQAFRVYPDLSAVRRYGALHARNRLLEAGVRRMRLRGGGTEFESLRDYADGDSFRTIDWKATARRGKMMVAQHEVERSQDVMLAIDCGRLMTARAGAQRKLDYAVTAALSLAAIASLAHDRVGVVAFAAEMLAARAPRSTAASMHAITNAISDVEPRFEESDFARAARYLRAHLRRRSLIVLFTDAIDPIAQSTVLAELTSLARRHLVLCVFMNDAAIGRTLAAAPANVTDAYAASVALELARERAVAARTLALAGIKVLDVPAAALSAATIDEYLRIKARGAL